MRTLVSLTLMLPLCASASLALAQAPDSATARHQIGLTASPQLDGFFKNNRSLPLGLFYQRQLTPTKALRLRLVGLVSYADSTNSTEGPFGVTDGYVTGPSYRRWQVQVFAGYAWQRPLGRRFTLDYGLEAGLGYQRQGFSAARRQSYSPGGFVVDYFERTTQDLQVQARPFAGFSYRPTPRLRLFAETALPLTYTHQRMKYQVREEFTKSDEMDRFLDQRARANRVALTWRPVQLVGATYAF
ncbi:hypothetical protein [Hymenobacter elongatus]|uniref:DUF3575 domain-containing protein n=1 Tax=Hymenobacter elongatus TaxID=877208 RepID=A0A4Z0PQ93_9BACT|nr:hypothetical protein [Hymenobacter elongatus]TGE19685.1 hypothetical protein E5J99_02690 [Hymenobacter elongatus]TGE19687.1 hypothetical protein E5J99_02700 [Hymenobacter elongatus]